MIVAILSKHMCSALSAVGNPGKALLAFLFSVGLVLSSSTYAAPISPRRLLEVTDLDGVSISPDGRMIAFRTEQVSVERNTYDTTWYVQWADGRSPPHKVADGGLSLKDIGGLSRPIKALWSTNSRWIYYLAFIDGKLAVWRAASDGSAARPMTRESADVRDFLLSDDGASLNYSVGASREAVKAAEQEEYDKGIHIDETTPIGQPLFRSGNIGGRLATQRYRGAGSLERVLLLAEEPEIWKSLDLVTGQVRILSSSEVTDPSLADSDMPKDFARPWKVSVEPGKMRIALLTKVGDGTGLVRKPDVELAMLPGRRTRRPVVCRAAFCTGKPITEIQWRPGSDDVLFTTTDPHDGLAQTIFRWNVRSGAVNLVTHENGQLNGRDFRNTPTCDVSKDALFCITSKADRPPRLERINIETGLRKILFDPNASLAQDFSETTPAHMLRWSDPSGQEFTGQFFQARGSAGAPAPLFITYYRCTGFLRGGLGNEWPLASLAEAGISALCINDPPRQPLDAVERYDRPLAGVRAVIELLASEGLINRSKVGMGGLSFGTEVTLWTAVNSDLLAAASVSSITMAPNVYLFLSLQGHTALERLKTVWGLGTLEETPERWSTLSMTRHLAGLKAPVLMQIPEQEYIFALEYAIPLIRRQQADLYVFPNEPHQKFQPKHKLAVYERNLDWFRFWLQGYQDPDPAKAVQYANWRGMRAARDATEARSTTAEDHPPKHP